MRRYLVVANQTLGGGHLLRKVRECLEEGECSFHILVPATPPRDQLTYTEGRAEAVARERLEQALERFREVGAEVSGAVGAPEPLDAIRDVVRRESFDEILLSTLPAGPSRWLKQDLPHRVERAFTVPVTHIVMETEPKPA